MSDHKVLNAPERIWLTYGEALYEDVEHQEVMDSGEVMWSAQRIEPHDIEYVRADLHEAEVERQAAIRKEALRDNREKTNEIRRLRALVDELADDLEVRIEHEYSGTLDFPDMKRKYDLNIAVVREARKALEDNDD